MFRFRSGFVQGATNGVAEVPNLIGVYRHINIFHTSKYASDNIVLKDIKDIFVNMLQTILYFAGLQPDSWTVDMHEFFRHNFVPHASQQNGAARGLRS